MKKGAAPIEVIVAILLVMIVLATLISYGPKLLDLIKTAIGVNKIDTNDKNSVIADEIKKTLSPPSTLRINLLRTEDKRAYIISWRKSTSPKIEKYEVIREEEDKPPVNICELPVTAQETYTCTDDRGDLRVNTKYKYTVIVYDFNGDYSEISDVVTPNR